MAFERRPVTQCKQISFMGWRLPNTGLKAVYCTYQRKKKRKGKKKEMASFVGLVVEGGGHHPRLVESGRGVYFHQKETEKLVLSDRT